MKDAARPSPHNRDLGSFQPDSDKSAAVTDGDAVEGHVLRGLTLSLDICPGPLKEVDLHRVLFGDGPIVVEEALRLAAGIPAAAGCFAGGLARLPEEACSTDSLLSVHDFTSPTCEQPDANLFMSSSQTCCAFDTQADSICASLPMPAFTNA